MMTLHSSGSGGDGVLLAINAGSSSLKFAVVRADRGLARLAAGTAAGGAGSAAASLDRLQQQLDFQAVAAVGHRVVLSARRPAVERVTAGLLDLLRRAAVRDPDHLPAQLELIEEIAVRFPSVPQIACYDSAFHDTMPRIARLLPIPRRFDAAGIERFGFHGLSCAFLVEELARVAGADAANGRVILAHLGGGASLTAVHRGRSVDTTMGYTPAGGLVMGTRPGDLDPGLTLALMQREALTPEGFDRLINHECGLRGISETTGDMRELIAHEGADLRAAEAIELFCYQVRKAIGSFAAVLGGVETIVFAGGIGEHVPEVRERACRNLGFLGIEIDPVRNAANAAVISSVASRATVRVIPTDEEAMIAKAVWQEVKGGR